MAKPSRAGIYLRISQDRSGEALGVERQEQDCRALAARMGWIVTQVYRDNDISASTKSRKPRPGYSQMIKDAEDGVIDGIIVYNMDRLTRRMVELATFLPWLEEVGIPFMTTEGDDTQTTNGKMVIQIKGSVAQAEAERIAERVSRQREQARASGIYYTGGCRPFGWRDHKLTELDPRESAAIREGAKMILAGSTPGDVMRKWVSDGIPTVTGTHWHLNTVKHIFRHPRVAGFVAYKGEVVTQGKFAAVLDEATWRAVVNMMDSRSTLNGPGKRGKGYGARTHLLSGFVFCDRCSARMVVSTGYIEKGGKPYTRLVCVKARGGCGRMSRKYDWVMERVEAVMEIMLAQTPEMSSVGNEDEVQKIENQIQFLEENSAETRADMRQQLLSKEDAYNILAENREEITKLRNRLADLTQMASVSLEPDALQKWRDTRPENLQERRMLLGTIIDRIVIKEAGRTGRAGSATLPPDCIDIIPRPGIAGAWQKPHLQVVA